MMSKGKTETRTGYGAGFARRKLIKISNCFRDTDSGVSSGFTPEALPIVVKRPKGSGGLKSEFSFSSLYSNNPNISG